MKKHKALLILLICILIIILGGGILLFKGIVLNQKPLSISKQPIKNSGYTFPNNNPQFSVKITSKKTSPHASFLRQQAISIYHLNDTMNQSIFQRNYYADGFNGSELTYLFATDSASFKQQGVVETLSCPQYACSLRWNNFYTWDAKKNTFILDNVSHTDVFAQLLNDYKIIDEKGCQMFTQNVMTDQQGVSFSKLYQQYPNLSSYCTKTQGLSSSDLVYFLKAEKVIQEIIDGKNLSSNDIKSTSL